jgi:hypothetical protein
MAVCSLGIRRLEALTGVAAASSDRLHVHPTNRRLNEPSASSVVTEALQGIGDAAASESVSCRCHSRVHMTL